MSRSILFLGGSIIVFGVLLSRHCVRARIDDGIVTEDIYESEKVIPPHEAYHYTTPPCCQKPGVEDASYALISTMDGKLLALDIANGGNTVWEINAEGAPLMAGTLGGMPAMESNGRWYNLVPALDGSLYMYSRDDRLLEPIPLNTEILLQSSVRIAQDAVAGGRTVTTTGVDPLTGEIRYHCSANNCNNANVADVKSTLVFRRSTNAVRAVNALTGAERWNLSVSEYDASLVTKSSTVAAHRITTDHVRILVQPPDGIVTAYDGCGNQLWSRQIGSHIVRTWKMESAKLTELSLFDSDNIHTLAVADSNGRPPVHHPESLFYLGTMNNEPFIMHSDSVKAELKRMARGAIEATEIMHAPGTQLVNAGHNAYYVQDRTIDELLRITIGRSFSEQRRSHMADAQLSNERSQELTVVNPERKDGHIGFCPGGEGVSLIGEKDIRSAAFGEGEGDRGWFVMRPGVSTRRSPFSLADKPQCVARLKRRLEQTVDSWKHVIGFVLTLLVGVAGGVFVMRRYPRTPPRVVVVVESPRTSVETKETSIGPSIPGNAESVPSSPSESTPTAMPVFPRERRTTSTNSSSDPYQSKFLSDFEPVKLLGHGGFGLVFKARNRLDEGMYAVKRISVANKDVAIQRVLREVRAMARLDHQGIIRYYHTWIECPPPGWQDESDRSTLMGIKTKHTLAAGDNIVEESVLPSSVSPNEQNSLSEHSIEAPGMPDISNDGSWLEDSKSKVKAFDSDDESDTTESSVSSDDDISSSDECAVPVKHDKDSIDIVFGSSENSSRSCSNGVSALGAKMVVVTSNDDDLFPSRSTENFVYLYIQMQLCQEKTLHSWLKQHKRPEHRPLNKMKMWLGQLCNAVNYIHSQGLIHRDLKPQNIFFYSENYLKVGDLGLVTKVFADDEEPAQKCKAKSGSLHTDNVGTRGYMSPEQISNKAYTFKVDVFSLGLIFCELIVPFQTCMERSRTLGGLQRGESPSILDNCGVQEKKMVLWMTKMSPGERPSTEDILCSDYLADTDYEEPTIVGSRRRYRSERSTEGRKISAFF